jgi:hypothetical protein
MYINFWYPVCTAEELTDEPMQVQLLGLKQKVPPMCSAIPASIAVVRWDTAR